VSLAEWIRTRSPAPPPDLLARIDALTANVSVSSTPADALLDAAESAMDAVLQSGCLTRDSALALLAVDAIVTYAFEAAADDPATLEPRTQRALQRIAALVQPYRI
jgi:hypothetical protein